jgi:hypothetical protein
MTHEFAAFLKSYGLRTPYMLHPEVEKGKSLYRYDFEHYFDDYVRAQNLPFRLTTHIMRHTFASLLASARAEDGGPANSIYEIAVWLGDDIRVVQKHYAKLLPVKRDVGRAFRTASPPGKCSSPKPLNDSATAALAAALPSRSDSAAGDTARSGTAPDA